MFCLLNRRIPSGGDSSLAPAEHWPWGQAPGGEAWLCPLAAPHPRQVTGAALMLGCLVAKQLPPSWRCESFMWWGGAQKPPARAGEPLSSEDTSTPPLSTSTCSASSNSRVQGMGTGNVFLVDNLFCSDETDDFCGAYFVTDKLSFLVNLQIGRDVKALLYSPAPSDVFPRLGKSRQNSREDSGWD